MKLTILAEDTVYRHSLTGEHGLAVLVERGGKSWLFDTGQAGAASRNAAKLGIDLRGISSVILSHGHYDHAGGLMDVLDAAGPKEVLCHPGVFAGRVCLEKDGKRRDVGIPWKRGEIEEKGGGVHFNEGPVTPSDGVMLSGTIPIPARGGNADTALKTRKGGREVVDRVEDEQCLILDSAGGIVVVLGCAHRGVAPMLDHARRLAGGRRIYAVAGGLHLMRSGKAGIGGAVEAFRRLGVKKIAACHCTGPVALAALRNAFPRRFIPCSTGETFEL